MILNLFPFCCIVSQRDYMPERYYNSGMANPLENFASPDYKILGDACLKAELLLMKALLSLVSPRFKSIINDIFLFFLMSGIYNRIVV